MIKDILLKQGIEKGVLLSRCYNERQDIQLKPKFKLAYRIKLITGPRRSGKTVLALRLLKDRFFAYLNFDDDLLIKHFDEDVVMEGLNEVYPNFQYILLREIQHLHGWEIWVDNILNNSDIKLVITGSDTGLLSGKMTYRMGTSFAKRFHQIVVFPYSFK